MFYFKKCKKIIQLILRNEKNYTTYFKKCKKKIIQLILRNEKNIQLILRNVKKLYKCNVQVCLNKIFFTCTS